MGLEEDLKLFMNGMQAIKHTAEKFSDASIQKPDTTLIKKRSVFETREQAEVMQFKTTDDLSQMTEEQKEKYHNDDTERTNISREDLASDELTRNFRSAFGD